MEKENLYGKVHMKENADIVLEYYLISEEISEEYSNLKSYGVKINKISRYAGGGKTVEMKQINNIFCRIGDAEEFIKYIMKYQVTPITLRDVAEDYVVESLEKAKYAVH
jgi:hypothetical protein